MRPLNPHSTMPTLKLRILEYLEEYIQDHPEWRFVKTYQDYVTTPFNDIKLVVSAFATYNESRGLFQPSVHITSKRYSKVHNYLDLWSDGEPWAWKYKTGVYFTDYRRSITIWKLPLEEKYAGRKGWYVIEQLPEMIDELFHHGVALFEDVCDFSSEAAFLKSLIIEDDDPRIDDGKVLAQVGMFRQAILKMMHGNFDYAQKIPERYAHLMGPRNQKTIKQILDKLPELQANYERTGELI